VSKRIVLILASIVLMGVFLMGCSDRSRRTTPAIVLDPSVRNQILTLNAPTSEWGIDLTCYYGENSIYVIVSHPHIRNSPEVACTYFMDEGSGSCRPDFANSTCDCAWIPMTTRRFDILIINTGDPAPLEYVFPFRDLLPATCEEDPAGWTMGHLCDPGGGLYIEFAYPDTYDATACDIIDESGTTYACEMRTNDAGTDTVCGCHGLPVLGQNLIREIVLRDGTTVQAHKRFTGIDEHYCTLEIIPTQNTPLDTKPNPPPSPSCSDYNGDEKNCFAAGCNYWSDGTCNTSPEPAPSCKDYGDADTCKANGCTWDEMSSSCY
jgi:hypothetical protein